MQKICHLNFFFHVSISKVNVNVSSDVFSGAIDGAVKEGEPDTPDGMLLRSVEFISRVHLVLKPTENSGKGREPFRKYLEADWTNIVSVTFKDQSAE